MSNQTTDDVNHRLDDELRLHIQKTYQSLLSLAVCNGDSENQIDNLTINAILFASSLKELGGEL